MTARARAGAGRPYLVAGLLYLAAALLVWWHVWTGAGPNAVMTCACTDAGRGVWYLEWSAFALTHGHRLLYSTWLFHPGGFNLLTDTSVPAVGLVMSPVTLLFGPVAAFNVAATVAPAATALSMFWLLRRWVRWTPAAFVGGLVYGFSSFVLVQLAFGWLNLAVLVLVPPMVACLDDLLVRRARSPVRTGVLLGLLVTAEFFVSSEMVAILAVAGLVAILLLAAYAGLHRPDDLRDRLRHAGLGLASAAAVALVLLAYPVWSFVAGPGHLGGTLWSSDVPGDLGNSAANFWSRLGTWGPLDSNQLAAGARALGGYQGPPVPSPSFLGWGMLIVLAAGVVAWRRDRRLWLFGALGLITAVLGLRAGGGEWGPWALVDHLPFLRDVVQSRFSAVTDLCAAVMLGVIVDRTRWWAAGRPRLGPAGSVLAALAVAVVAVVPTAVVLGPNLPLTVQAVSVPRWFTDAVPRRPPGDVLATYPFATADSQAAIPWQAVAGMRFRMAGGGGPAGTVARAGDEAAGFAVLHAASVPLGPAPALTVANLAAVRRALRAWEVTTVVVPADAGLPAYLRGRGTSYGVAFYTAVLGSSPTRQAGAWVWSLGGPGPASSPHPLSAATAGRCAALPAGDGVAACVLAGGPPG